MFEFGARPPAPLARPDWRRTIHDRFVANTWRSLNRSVVAPFALTDVDVARSRSMTRPPDGLPVGADLRSWKAKGRPVPMAEAVAALDAGGPGVVIALAEAGSYMGLLDESLSRLLIGRNRPPSSFSDVVEAFGDVPRCQNPQIARELSRCRRVDALQRHGWPGYHTALRRVNRWRTTAAERRRPSPAPLPVRLLVGQVEAIPAIRVVWLRRTM